MPNITEAEKKKIIGLLTVLVPEVKIYLFGSRARGTHSPHSDIDIALDAGEALSLAAIDEAKSVMAASNLIYRIDVVDMNRVSDDMRSVIMQEGILWDTKEMP